MSARQLPRKRRSTLSALERQPWGGKISPATRGAAPPLGPLAQVAAQVAYGGENDTLTGSGEPEQFTGNNISPAFIRVFGIEPIAARALFDLEERPGSAPSLIQIMPRFGLAPSTNRFQLKSL